MTLLRSLFLALAIAAPFVLSVAVAQPCRFVNCMDSESREIQHTYRELFQ